MKWRRLDFQTSGATRWLLLTAVLSFCSTAAWANSDYYRHHIFDNRLTPDKYFYSVASANGGSFLEQTDSRLPVENKIFRTPPNALRLQWTSQPGEGWEAEVHSATFRNRFPSFSGDNLYFWCFATEPMAEHDLPSLVLSTAAEGVQVAEFPASFAEPVPIGKFSGALPGGRWVRVRIPLDEFHSASIYQFRPEFVRSIIFHQARQMVCATPWS